MGRKPKPIVVENFVSLAMYRNPLNCHSLLPMSAQVRLKKSACIQPDETEGQRRARMEDEVADIKDFYHEYFRE